MRDLYKSLFGLCVDRYGARDERHPRRLSPGAVGPYYATPSLGPDPPARHPVHRPDPA